MGAHCPPSHYGHDNRDFTESSKLRITGFIAPYQYHNGPDKQHDHREKCYIIIKHTGRIGFFLRTNKLFRHKNMPSKSIHSIPLQSKRNALSHRGSLEYVVKKMRNSIGTLGIAVLFFVIEPKIDCQCIANKLLKTHSRLFFSQ